MDFSLAHVKERYQASIADRRVSLHAILAEMLGTGIVVLVGTSAVQFTRDALEIAKLITQAQHQSPTPVSDRAPPRSLHPTWISCCSPQPRIPRHQPQIQTA